MLRLLQLGNNDRIGLLGGTFDPPHWGHIRAARGAADELELDQIAFLPSPCPPHKGNLVYTPYTLRRRMVELCLRYDPRFRICLVEEQADLSGTTLKTICRLRKIGFTENHCHLIWLLGSDALLDLPNWYEPEQLLAAIEVAVMPRPGFPSEQATQRFLKQVRLLKTPLFPFSATEIRTHHLDLLDSVPKPLAKFIRQNSLYGFHL